MNRVSMDYTSFLKSICEVAQFCTLIPITIGLLQYQHIGKPFRFILLLFGVLTCMSIIGYWLYLRKENNIPIAHLYGLTEGLGWSAIYLYLLRKRGFRLVLLGLIGVFVFIFWVNTGSWDLLYSDNVMNQVVSSLVLLYCSIAYSIDLLEIKSSEPKRYEAFLWLNAGVFVYGLNSCTFALVFTWLSNNQAAPILELWALYSVFLISHYVVVTIAIWKHSTVPISG